MFSFSIYNTIQLLSYSLIWLDFVLRFIYTNVFTFYFKKLIQVFNSLFYFRINLERKIKQRFFYAWLRAILIKVRISNALHRTLNCLERSSSQKSIKMIKNALLLLFFLIVNSKSEQIKNDFKEVNSFIDIRTHQKYTSFDGKYINMIKQW